MNKLLLVLTVLTISSCGGGYFERQENARNAEVIRLGEEARERQSNPNKYAYNDATVDGCNTAKADAGMLGYRANKDIDMYVKDEYYKAGFDDGYKKCKAESDRLDDAYEYSRPYRW